jgi:hypothetical protein
MAPTVLAAALLFTIPNAEAGPIGSCFSSSSGDALPDATRRATTPRPICSQLPGDSSVILLFVLLRTLLPASDALRGTGT